MDEIDSKLDLIAKMLDDLRQDTTTSPRAHARIQAAYNAVIKAQAFELRDKGK